VRGESLKANRAKLSIFKTQKIPECVTDSNVGLSVVGLTILQLESYEYHQQKITEKFDRSRGVFFFSIILKILSSQTQISHLSYRSRFHSPSSDCTCSATAPPSTRNDELDDDPGAIITLYRNPSALAACQ
jgi:hypothetical protein